jgi:RecA/RadA recombinase
MAKKKDDAIEAAEAATSGASEESSSESSEVAPVKVVKHSRLDKVLVSDTLKAIAKKHGVSIIRRASEHHSAVSQFIPSGSLSMDWALGGGWRVGGIHTVWGPKSSGKTSTLLKTIGNAQEMCANCWNFVTFFDGATGEVLKRPTCPCGKYREVVVGYINNEGCIAGSQEIMDPRTGFVGTVEDFITAKEARHVCSWHEGKLAVAPAVVRVASGVQETVKVSTSTTSLQCTPDHPILTWRKGKPSWVHAGKLKKGDRIARPWKVTMAGSDTGVSVGLAELVGLMVGDGSFDANSSLVLTNTDDDIWKRVSELLRPWGCKVTKYDDRHGRLVSNSGSKNELRRRMAALGLLGSTANHKFLPQEILNSTQDVVAAALQGLWMSDGGVSSSNAALHFTSTSRRLMLQVKWLLSRLGILGHIYTQHDGDELHQPWHVLWIYGVDNLKKFQAAIPLYGHKGKLLSRWCSRASLKSKPSSENYLPSYNPRDKRHIKHREQFLNKSDVWWDTVEAVAPAGKAPTYDAGIPLGHSWTVSDILVHNTWDQKWARGLGINTDSLLLSEPEYAEQSLDIAEALLRDGNIDILAMDSLAFMTPEKEIEQSASKETMGSQSRVLGKGIRKFVSALNHMGNTTGRKPTVFFTNQVRFKIGVMFGNPETQPGGMAPQFAATTEVKFKTAKYEIEKVKGEKEEKEAIDIDLMLVKPLSVLFTFKCEKNKQGHSMMEGGYRVALGNTETHKKGDVLDASVIMDQAERYEILKKEGSKWLCAGVPFGTKGEIESLLVKDQGFKRLLSKRVMECLLAD